MTIEITERLVAPQEQRLPKLQVKEITFASRRATFVVASGNNAWAETWAVMFRVGPLGLNVSADEAEALGNALVAAAQHYRAALANVSGGAA